MKIRPDEERNIEDGKEKVKTTYYAVYEDGHEEVYASISADYVDETETTEPVEEPTDEEIIQAEMLLNQQEILINQQAQDEVLAEILLGQQTM